MTGVRTTSAVIAELILSCSNMIQQAMANFVPTKDFKSLSLSTT